MYLIEITKEHLQVLVFVVVIVNVVLQYCGALSLASNEQWNDSACLSETFVYLIKCLLQCDKEYILENVDGIVNCGIDGLLHTDNIPQFRIL